MDEFDRILNEARTKLDMVFVHARIGFDRIAHKQWLNAMKAVGRRAHYGKSWARQQAAIPNPYMIGL